MPEAMLFGVGRLLRELRMTTGAVGAPATLAIVSTPQVALRGHQLGYRPKTNSYDAWDVPMWEQYIRDLAIFGTNAIELMPPRSDDAADSPHFPLPQMEMMVQMSRIADEYGLDVWVWYPAHRSGLRRSAGRSTPPSRNGPTCCRRLPRVDAVFVPGGDPGHTQPKLLMAMLERQTASLHKYSSDGADVDVAAGLQQGAWMNEFYGMLASRAGVADGRRLRPAGARQLADPAQERAEAVSHPPLSRHHAQPARQYPVHDWDVAHALTSQREQINPRPELRPSSSAR